MNDRPFTVLVVGGYGVFGTSVCRMLAAGGERVLVAGRNLAKAEAVARSIRAGDQKADVAALECDKTADLAGTLRRTGARLLIDAAGPFQGQDYATAETCIAEGVHYVDLSDARCFVAEFGRLDAAAKAAGVTAVSGASSVPGLSSAVVDHLTHDMKEVDSIASAIMPGNRAPRGHAVVAAILGYVGKPIPVLRNGGMAEAYGWQDLRRLPLRIPDGRDLGHRWVSACDIPDNVLFPGRYRGVDTVTFHAGLELGLMHLGLWALSWPVRWGVFSGLTPLAPLALRIADVLRGWGSDSGGMVVEVRGTMADGAERRRRWTLIAGSGDGPQIPAVPAVILARKLARGWSRTGAAPCLGLFDVSEFEQAVSGLDIHCATEDFGD